MKYISLDLEFSSLDLEEAKILEIGAIIEDTNNQLSYNDIPKFQCYIYHKSITGSSTALYMNSRILKILSEYENIKDKKEKEEFKKENNILHDYEVTEVFYHFLYRNNMIDIEESFDDYIQIKDGEILPMLGKNTPKVKLTLAGKNLQSKDVPLLKTLPRWGNYFIMSHRNLDPVSLYVDWKNDSELPNLSTCKKRAGLDDVVTHYAIDDAWDIIQLLRKKY